MKLASVSSLVSAAVRIFRRFPATIVSAILAAAVAIDMVGSSPVPDRSMHLLMVTALGIPLFTSLRLFWEKSPWGRPLALPWMPIACGAGLLLFYGWALGRDPGDARYLRYFQISLALHLAVALAPFLGRGEINGFWQFNRRLFLRFILSAIYASVFFGGLALALAAVNNLFDAKIGEEIYPRLWFFTVFVFQTWHFLGGVPENLADLDRDPEHPRALQIFSQYMLVPLVSLYVVILYAYMGKILLTRQWPEGWVGWMVSFAAVFGVLTLLLLHPGRQEKGNRWMEIFGRAFYAAVLPLLGLLFAALAKRTGAYGMTEKRYFLLVLGLWLGGVSLYMLFSAAKSIKIVPATLALITLVTSCGPWGAYGVSLRSQSGRLETLLAKHGLLSNGRIVAATHPVGHDDLKEISAAVDYVVEQHGAVRLSRWDTRDWAAVASKADEWSRSARVSQEFMAAMGLEYVAAWGMAGITSYYDSQNDPVDIAGYDLLVPADFNRWANTTGAPGKYSARIVDDGRTIEILKGPAVILTESLEPMLTRLPPKSQTGVSAVPISDMSLTAANTSLRVKVCFKSLMVSKTGNGTSSVQGGSGYLLIDTSDNTKGGRP